MNSTTQSTILGLDPGTRYMGVAVVRGPRLLAHGVHVLRNGEDDPYELIGQARRVVLRYIERFGPEVVAIERPYRISERRAELLSTLTNELQGRTKELGLTIQLLSPEAVREHVTGNALATKLDVAERLVREFRALRDLVPLRPLRSASGLRAKDKYWLHMFDALVVARAASVQLLP